MDKLQHFGRLCFAISIAFFGAQYVLYGRFEGGLRSSAVSRARRFWLTYLAWRLFWRL